VASDEEVARAPSREELARAARSGSLWAITQSVASKATSVVGQIVLGWLLTEGDLGLVATALSIVAVGLFFNPPLMADVLLQRKERFDIDARAALWLSLGLAAATSLVLAIAAPFLAAWYGEPELVGVLLVVAATPLGSALQAPALARLRIDLRLGAIARWSIALSIGSTVASVALAAFGAGPYAIALPSALVAFLAAFFFMRIAGSSQRTPDGRPPAWGALFREYATVCAGQYAHTLSLFCDYIALSLFASTEELGLYYFAYRLSAQINGLVAYNTSTALQPVFSHLGDDPRAQSSAFLNACRAMTLAAMPLCLLQAALATAGIALVFQERWLPAIPLLALLSLAQAFFTTVGPTQAMLKAQSRFGSYVRWQGWQAAALLPALFLAAGAIGPWLERTYDLANARSIAVAAMLVVVYAISCPVGIWLAVRGRGGTIGAVLRLYALPFLVALPAAAAAVAATWFFLGVPFGTPDAAPSRTAAGIVVAASLVLFGPLVVGTLVLLAPNDARTAWRVLRRR
jgi:PST family polysaccharide transporter